MNIVMYYYHFSDSLNTQICKGIRMLWCFTWNIYHLLFGVFFHVVTSHSSCGRQPFAAQHTPPSWEQDPKSPLRKQSSILLESESGTLPVALGVGLDWCEPISEFYSSPQWLLQELVHKLIEPKKVKDVPWGFWEKEVSFLFLYGSSWQSSSLIFPDTVMQGYELLWLFCNHDMGRTWNCWGSQCMMEGKANIMEVRAERNPLLVLGGRICMIRN